VLVFRHLIVSLASVVLTIFLLVVNFLEQGLIEKEFLLVHLASLLSLFVLHLSLEEFGVLLVDLANLGSESVLLFVVILLISLPHLSLLVIQILLHIFSALFILHLLSKEVSHALLLSLDFLVFALVFHAFTELLLHFVPSNLVFLLSCLIVHLLNDSISHLVHELLCTLLSCLKFIDPILLLLVQHAGILLLSPHILQPLLLSLLQRNHLLSVIFGQHLLEILFLLPSLLLNHLSFLLHFKLEAFHKLNLLLVRLLFLNLLAMLLLEQLSIPGLLLEHDLSLQLLLLLLLSVLQQFQMLLLKLLIHLVFLLFPGFLHALLS